MPTRTNEHDVLASSRHTQMLIFHRSGWMAIASPTTRGLNPRLEIASCHSHSTFGELHVFTVMELPQNATSLQSSRYPTMERFRLWYLFLVPKAIPSISWLIVTLGSSLPLSFFDRLTCTTLPDGFLTFFVSLFDVQEEKENRAAMSAHNFHNNRSLLKCPKIHQPSKKCHQDSVLRHASGFWIIRREHCYGRA